MKTISKKSNIKKFIAIGVAVVIVLAAPYFLYAKSNDTWPFTTPEKKPTTKKKDKEPTKNTVTTDKKDEPATTPTTLPSDKNIAPNSASTKTTDEIPIKQTSTARITQLEQKNHRVYFAANVTNAAKAGRCVVSFTTPNDRPVIKEFDAKLKGGKAYCGQLSISELEFSYLGNWKVTLRYYVDSKQVTTSGNINIS